MAKATRKATVPLDESKEDKFKRLANQRIKRARAAIAALAKLGTAAYVRTPEQVGKLVAALKADVAAMEAALMPRAPGAARSSMPDVL